MKCLKDENTFVKYYNKNNNNINKMNCSTKDIIIISVIVFIVLILILGITGFIFLKSGNKSSGTPSGDCGTLLGVWYKADAQSTAYAAMSIGNCTDENGIITPFIDPDSGLEWPMCGSMLATGINSGGLLGPEIWCSDCKFRFNENCHLEMYSKCLETFVGKFAKDGPYFRQDGGWSIDYENGIINTASGNWNSLDSNSQFPNKMIQGNTPTPNNSCPHKYNKNNCQSNMNEWTSCDGLGKGGCCCGNKDCCPSSETNNILKFLGFV